MAFYETRFPVDISVESATGPGWMTDVIVMHSGKESRQQKWEEVRSEYDAAYGVKTMAQLHSLRDFFNEMRGRAHGFRFKDWFDYSVTDEPLVPDGGPTVQLIKTYGSGFNNYVKNITKPVSGEVTINLGGSEYGSGSYTVDTTTGIVTLDPLDTIDILDITQASPAEVTTDGAHGLSNGDQRWLTGIGGMTELNDTEVVITVTGSDTFTIGVNTTAYTAYTSGGEVREYAGS